MAERDSAGTQVAHYEYTPYGELFSTEGVSVPHKFTGKELDPETGFYFYEARYYDPQLGRFITPDSFVPNWSDPQDFNRYTYAGNNPLRYTDPTGHFKFGKFFKKFWQSVVTVAAFAAAPFTAGQSLWALAALQVYNGVQAIRTGQFGAFAAGLAISAAFGGFSPLNFGNIFMQVGIGALRGAALGAISGGVASVISGGSFGAGLAQGAIGGAIGGATSAFFTSQQYQNWAAGNGFVNNATLAAQQAGQGGNLQGAVDGVRQGQGGIKKTPSTDKNEQTTMNLAGRTPRRGDPGSIQDYPKGNGGLTRRRIGENGEAEIDIDWGHDHGAGDPHGHIWTGEKRGPEVPIGDLPKLPPGILDPPGA